MSETAAVDAAVDRYRADPGYLLQMLRDVEAAEGWISPASTLRAAKRLDIPRTRIDSLVRFHAFLHDKPAGAYRLRLSDNVTDRMQGSLALFDRFLAAFGVKRGETSPDGLVSVDLTSCTGLCDQGPGLLVNGRAIARLDPPRVDEIVGLVRRRAALADWPAELFAVSDNVRRAMALLAEPMKPGRALDAAIALGRQGVIDEMKRSALRGRGGAGFPTGLKWEACRNAPGAERFIVCNADEGEPGTFKDRVLLRRAAARVFEGLAIAGFAVGARRGFLYLRGEYEFLREALEAELADMRASGRLGIAIRGAAGFDFDIEIHMGAGAYVCGEESALIESLEGKPGRPRIRPPFPVTHGYLGKPTVVDNVETLAQAAEVVIQGGAAFAGLGTRASTGAKVLSVSGDCERPGIYEYPFGVRVARVLEDCGARDAAFVQVSGPSGVCLTPDEFHRAISFEDVPTAGAFMVFDSSRDYFEIARNFAHFFAHESCGFCTPCRVGASLQRDLMDKIAEGRGSHYEVNELMRLSELMKRTSHCGLGQTAGHPFNDAWRKFRPAFEKRLQSRDFAPAVDLEAALEAARAATHRDDALAHLEGSE
jgi:[NiFe] hydrogenase diaphorase moiety large subunit